MPNISDNSYCVFDGIYCDSCEKTHSLFDLQINYKTENDAVIVVCKKTKNMIFFIKEEEIKRFDRDVYNATSLKKEKNYIGKIDIIESCFDCSKRCLKNNELFCMPLNKKVPGTSYSNNYIPEFCPLPNAYTIEEDK